MKHQVSVTNNAVYVGDECMKGVRSVSVEVEAQTVAK